MAIMGGYCHFLMLVDINKPTGGSKPISDILAVPIDKRKHNKSQIIRILEGKALYPLPSIRCYGGSFWSKYKACGN